MASSETQLEEELLEAGNKLQDPPSSAEEILLLLDRVEGFLSRVEQSPTNSMQIALSPSMRALVTDKLLRHSDADVKVAVASCISEITRISAPDAPFDDDQMKEIFQLIVSSFENLYDKSSRSYAKRTSILETVAKVRSCVVMLDLECDALILEMFEHFLKEIREHHSENVFSAMETIMTLVIEESEDISLNLLSPLLASIKKDQEEVLPIAQLLGERVLESCATKLKPYLVQAVKTLGVSVEDYSSVLASICQDASDSVEQNDVCATSEHAEDENKSVKQSLEDLKHVVKEDAREAALCQQDNPAGDESPKSSMSNGTAQVGEDEPSADPKSPKKQEDADCSDQSKGMDISGHEVSNDLDAETVDNSEPKQKQATKKQGKESSSSTKSTEPSVDQALANEKDAEKKLDSNQSKDTSLSGHEVLNTLDTETVDNSERKQEEATKRQGRKSSTSTNSTEPSVDQAVDNEMEGEKKLDSESHSEEVPSSPHENHSVEATGLSENEKVTTPKISSPEAGDLDTETVENMEQKQEQATQRHGEKSSTSTKSTEPSVDQAVGNEMEAEKKLDSESHSKEIPSSPLENNSVEATGSSENEKEINPKISSPEADDLDTETVDNSEQNQEQNTRRRGRKSSTSTKSTEPSVGQAIDNKKKAEEKLDSESHSKEVPSSPHENHSVETTGPSVSEKEINPKISSPEAGDLDTEAVDNSEQKQEQATKRRGRKSGTSIKSTEPSLGQAVDNKKKAEKKLDSENRSKKVPRENHSVEASGPSENVKETNPKVSSPEAGNNESEVVASPTPSESLHNENRSKKFGQAKPKDGSEKEVAVEDASKKVSDGTGDSEAKPAKRSGKKAPVRNSDVKKTPVPDSGRNGSGATSNPDAKKQSAKKVDESNKVGGGYSSRQPGKKKKLGRGKADSEAGPSKDVDKEKVSSPRSGTKLAKDENSEETPKTNVKQKHTSGKVNESDTKEYGENLVGLRVKVWWPLDSEFYKGEICSFDFATKKHKVKYDDDEEETLNLRKEEWMIIKADSDSNQDEGSDCASLEASADMPPEKKGKTSTGESIKQGKMDASSKSGGAAASSRTKGASTKSIHQSKDASKSKDSKTIGKSEDEISRKPNTPKSGSSKSAAAAAQKVTSKSKDSNTSKTGKPKQETPKSAASKVKSSKSGGKSNVNGTGREKSGLLKRKVPENEDSDVSEREIEDVKGNSSSSKARGSEGKSGKANLSGTGKVKSGLLKRKVPDNEDSDVSEREIDVKAKTSTSSKARGSVGKSRKANFSGTGKVKAGFLKRKVPVNEDLDVSENEDSDVSEREIEDAKGKSSSSSKARGSEGKSGKANFSGTGKVKSGLLKRKVPENEDSDVSEREIEDTKGKGKASSSSKAKGSEGKSGKKQRRS